MEHIREAIERARNRGRTEPRIPPGSYEANGHEAERGLYTLLDPARLEANRIVAHDDSDPRSKNFHMLRTQVIQAMDAKEWQFLAVISPTARCGRTTTAINLGLSVARQPDRSVLLVDLDLSRTKIATLLGLQCDRGLAGTLAGRTTLAKSVVPLAIGQYRLLVLPSEAATPNSSEWLASRAMSSVLLELRTFYRSSIVIFDLPPLLRSDDAISILPHMDCVLLVTAAGLSTLSELRDCDRYLRESEVVRIVLNRAPRAGIRGR
jgi:Mrp family chromosome partitioning ATPase